MKFLPLIGALLLSTAPVHADEFQTVDDLRNARFETRDICNAAENYWSHYFLAFGALGVICMQKSEQVIDIDEFNKRKEGLYSYLDVTNNPLAVAGIKKGIEWTLVRYPECPLEKSGIRLR